MGEIHERYIIRHKILEALYNKADKRPKDLTKIHEFDCNDTTMYFRDLVKELGLPFKVVYKYHVGLHHSEVGNQVKCLPNGGQTTIGLEEDGLNAYLDEFWLRKGEKEVLELEQHTSVIRTNRSTRKHFAGSLLLGALSTVFIILTVVLQSRDKSDQELKGIKEELKAIRDSIGKAPHVPLSKENATPRTDSVANPATE